MPATEALVREFKDKLTGLSWQARLGALKNWPDLKVALSSSFGFEDQALTHVIATEKLPIRIFTLDTGRLFEETHKTHQETRERYKLSIETYFPDAAHVQALVNKNGINGFYNSLENRKACCYLRKVEPLKPALKGTDVWISGLRREHSENRSHFDIAEWDTDHNLVKLYPLIDIGSEELWAFIRANNVPYNELHDKGFPSIGCAPCTRAVKPGEPPRAGRWWWEQDKSQECGLHMVEGKLVRAKGGAGA